MLNWKILSLIIIYGLPFLFMILRFKTSRWIKIILLTIYVYVIAARESEMNIPLFLIDIFSQYQQIPKIIVIILLLCFAYYLNEYRKATYEDIIARKLRGIGTLSYHLFEKKRLTTALLEQWENGICTLLFNSIILLKKREYQEMFGQLGRVNRLLKFTADSNYAFHIRTLLKKNCHLDENFLQRKSQQLLSVISLRSNVPSFSPDVETFLMGVIREVNSQFRMFESDVSAASFSKNANISSKMMNTRDIVALNFQLWGRSAITFVKYEKILHFSSSLFIPAILVLPKSIWIYGLWFANLLVFMLGFSELNNIGYLIARSFKYLDSKSKTFKYENLPELIAAHLFLDNLDWMEDMTEETKCKNLSLLLYLMTTFPKKRVREFKPVQKLSFLIHFDLDGIDESDLGFSLRLPFRYLGRTARKFSGNTNLNRHISLFLKVCSAISCIIAVLSFIACLLFIGIPHSLASWFFLMFFASSALMSFLAASLCLIPYKKNSEDWRIHGLPGFFSICFGFLISWVFLHVELPRYVPVFFFWCFLLTGVCNLYRSPLKKLIDRFTSSIQKKSKLKKRKRGVPGLCKKPVQFKSDAQREDEYSEEEILIET